LGNRCDVVVVERAVQGATAVTGCSEGDFLNGIANVWVDIEVVINQFFDVDQVSALRLFASARTHKSIVAVNLEVCHQKLAT
jgi:hypothetical protein